MGNMDRRELMRREMDLIAEHRRRSGKLACRFHIQSEAGAVRSGLPFGAAD
jgi:hypothetical protein